MKKIIYLISGLAILFLLTFNFSGCVDQDFEDIEPRVDTTLLIANTTIAELKSMYPGSLFQLSDTTFFNRDSIIIEGIVTSDDKTGNFYKTIVIQDASGAIEVKLDKTNLSNDYKLGQRLIIYCNSLYLGDYGGLIQIGSAYTENGYKQIGGMEGDVIINKHVFRKGETPVPVTPLVINPSLLTAANISKLVKVENVQFETLYFPGTTTPLTYADKASGESLDHILKGCIDNYNSNLVGRSSGFASFANKPISNLKGSVVGVLSYYNGTFQLIIRDLNDINFTEARCL